MELLWISPLPAGTYLPGTYLCLPVVYLEVDSGSLGSQERLPPPQECCIRSPGGRTQNVIQQGWPASDPATYPLWFTPDIHQKKNTRLKTSYLFKDPVTKDKTKVICIFRVQISWRTRFTSKYVCFPSHRESLVVTRGVRQGPCPLNLRGRGRIFEDLLRLRLYNTQLRIWGGSVQMTGNPEDMTKLR